MMPLLPSTPALLCHRGADGAIDALSRQPLNAQEQLAGGWQEVSPDHPEVEAFARLGADNDNVLSRTDIGLIRVLEDLIDTLISRGLIQFTDLPATAQATRADRKRIKELEREVLRKDRALAETAALLVLSKKVAAIFNKSEDE